MMEVNKKTWRDCGYRNLITSLEFKYNFSDHFFYILYFENNRKALEFFLNGSCPMPSK